MPPPIAVDLRQCMDGSAVAQLWWPGLGTAHVAGLGAACLGQAGQTDRRMDRGIA